MIGKHPTSYLREDEMLTGVPRLGLVRQVLKALLLVLVVVMLALVLRMDRCSRRTGI